MVREKVLVTGEREDWIAMGREESCKSRQDLLFFLSLGKEEALGFDMGRF
jgi:hypothetical protein